MLKDPRRETAGGFLKNKRSKASAFVVSMQVGTRGSRDLVELIRLERRAFAAKIRAARAILGWSQSELGLRVGMTQRAIHKLEQGDTEPRRATVRAIDDVWHAQGIEFEDLADGGFRVIIRAHLLDQPETGSAPPQSTGTRSSM